MTPSTITASKVNVFAVGQENSPGHGYLFKWNIMSITKKQKFVSFSSSTGYSKLMKFLFASCGQREDMQFVIASPRLHNIPDRSWKSAPVPFNNKGEDHTVLIYCLIKIQPLPSP